MSAVPGRSGEPGDLGHVPRRFARLIGEHVAEPLVGGQVCGGRKVRDHLRRGGQRAALAAEPQGGPESWRHANRPKRRRCRGTVWTMSRDAAVERVTGIEPAKSDWKA